MEPAKIFSICTTLVDVHMNWRNWFHFLILEGGLLAILTDCITYDLRFNRHLLTVGSFQADFLYPLSFCASLSLTPYLIVAIRPYME